jgi:hypothetical protein
MCADPGAAPSRCTALRRQAYLTNRIKMAAGKVVVLGLLCKEEISSSGIKKDTAQSTYIEYHSVSPLVGIGTLPPPSLASECGPSPGNGGGAHSLAGEGLGGPNSDD